MGMSYPSTMAAMRRMKAEGGWAVVCTEETDIHPSGDITPLIQGRLWDDRDIPTFARMNEGVHAHGAWPAIELVHTGRATPASTAARCRSASPISRSGPATIRRRRAPWTRRHQGVPPLAREAAMRAQKAGFDVI